MLMVLFILNATEAYASHAQGADLTYQCLGGNNYQFTLKFYRDCAGVNAPNNVTINCISASLSQNFNLQLNPIPNTGNEVTPICPSQQTTCTGGNNPGVREYIYQGTTVLNPAVDWVFSFTLCCRNVAINTINAPGAQNIYVEAHLNNLNFPCNSSPTFTNRPVPYICANQNFCFNHGASDPDGDLLVYSLITPLTGPNSTVTYINPYTAQQPLQSNPPVTFNTQTGDICMTPTLLEVTVMAVKVEEWRNNQLVGSVIRDIQVQTMTCQNSNPAVNGINGTGTFTLTACAGQQVSFFTNSSDPDAMQTVTMTWNNGIPNATFTISNGPYPTGTFTWTPGVNDISPAPHCFTITVTDDNCPLFGSQTYSFCIYVTGLAVTTSSTNSNCGASNGSATATPNGGTGPFTYQWLPNGGNTQTQNGLTAGTYTVIITDATGCSGSSTVTILNNGMPSTLQTSSAPPSCTNGNNGTATVVANNQPPFTYLWSNGGTSSTITGLTPGNYSVVVTNSNGCTATATVTVVQPVPLTLSTMQTDASCFNSSNGAATANANGGSAPYTYLWSNGASTQSVNNLSAGNYFVTVTDAAGCTTVINVQINQPAQLQSNISMFQNATCFGSNDGSASVNVVGGVQPYQYSWNTNPPQIYQTASNLSSGNYLATITDANGCTITQNVFINQPQPVTAVNHTISVSCFGGNNGSGTVVPSGGTPPYTYSWNTVPVQTTSTATGLSAGTYQVMITDIYGCTGSVTVVVTEPNALAVTTGNIQNVSCNGGNNGTATGIVTGGTGPYTYSWNTLPVQTSPTATGLTAGNYIFTITDANGCSATSQINITQPALLATTATGTDTICPGQNVIVNATSTGGNGGYTYFWSNGLGAGASHTVSPVSTTFYTVITTDQLGCTAGPDTVWIYVYGLSAGNLTPTVPPAICSGGSTQVGITVSGFTGQVYYQWSNNLGNGPGPYTVSPNVTTSYTVTVTNQCGITASTAVTVIVNPNPVVSLAPLSATGCDEVSFSFANQQPVQAGSSYLWTFGDNTTSTGSNPVHSYSQSGNYIITLTITSPFGCIGTGSTSVNAVVNLSPDARFTADPFLTTNLTPTIHFTDQSTNATTWFWDFGDNSTSVVQHPVHTYTSTGIFTVKLITTNAAGCIDSVIHEVRIDPEFAIYIPNAFTPDGDNLNDVFMPKGHEIYDFKMEIFDRWGELIFQSASLNHGWDGKANSGVEIAQQGVYVYKISLRDPQKHEHFYTGHVSLIK